MRVHRHGRRLKRLFPLNRTWRFRADVVDHAIDTVYFIDDTTGDGSQHFGRNLCPVRCHPIGTRNRTQRHRVFVGALIPHHTYTFDGQKHG